MSIRRGTQERAGLGKPGSLAVGGLVTPRYLQMCEGCYLHHPVHVGFERVWTPQNTDPEAKIQTTNGVGTQTDAMGTAEGVRTIDCKPYKPWGTKV